MEVIYGRNVNSTYRESISRIRSVGQPQRSRAGEVRVAPTPVMTVTNRPEERVLFDPARDANPFFHFFECLWMLSGMDDGTWLDRFVSDFSERFAEQNGRIWGAYGKRWRKHFEWDQLNRAVELLGNDHRDRRVVIAMWDPVKDLWSEEWTSSDGPARDVPCNTHIYPRIVGGALDITVCCRSNDIVWGATGANAVHFSFLQEYLASRIGVAVGKMYQLSNNWHVYEEIFNRIMTRGRPAKSDPYSEGRTNTYRIMQDADSWDEELAIFMRNPESSHEYQNTFFPDVARPMWVVHSLWKNGKKNHALANANLSIMALDWRMAVEEWMRRRMS